MIFINSFSNISKCDFNKLPILSLNIVQKGSYIFPGEINCILVEAHLKNTSDSTIGFLVLSCSLYDSFVLDNDNFHILHNECSRNTSYPIKLEPHQEISIPLILQTNNSVLISSNTLKIGFIFIKDDIKINEPLLETINKCKLESDKLVWSKSFSVYHGSEPILLK